MRHAAVLVATLLAGCAQTPAELRSSTEARTFQHAGTVQQAQRCIADVAEEFQSGPLFSPLQASLREAAGNRPAEVHVRAGSLDPLYAMAELRQNGARADVRLHTWQPWVRAAEFEADVVKRCGGG